MLYSNIYYLGVVSYLNKIKELPVLMTLCVLYKALHEHYWFLKGEAKGKSV